MSEVPNEKPLPLLDRDSKPFWDSLQEQITRVYIYIYIHIIHLSEARL